MSSSLLLLTALALLAPETAKQTAPAQIRVLSVTGIDSNAHPWKPRSAAVSRALGAETRLSVRVVEDPDFLTRSEAAEYDVFVLHFRDATPLPRAAEICRNLVRLVEQGKGLVLIHGASGAFPRQADYRELARRTWGPKYGHDPRGPFTVQIVNRQHPVTRGLSDFQADDELYFGLAGDRPIEVLATAKSKKTGKDEPVAFVFTQGRGRVLSLALGHDAKAIDVPGAGELLRRACVWTAGEGTTAGDQQAASGASDLRIVVGFEGSCPQSLQGVKHESPSRFRIFPSWRTSPGTGEDAVGRSTHLGFKVANRTKSSQPVELWIDWQYHDAPAKDVPRFASVEEYMSYRDFVVVQRPGETAWRTVMADVNDSVAVVRLTVAPGETEIHWHPPYTYTQCEQFVASLRNHPLVRIEKLGESDEGRNLWLLRIADDSPRAKKPALFYSRVHAYESAGTYAMEGMVRWLISGEPYANAALRQYAFHVIPMVNPDGVFNGLGKLTSPRGADPQFLTPTVSRVQTLLKQTMDRVKPALYIDLHNWQNKHVDGLLFLEPAIRERFVRYMPAQAALGKQWMILEPTPQPAQPPEKELARMYCQRMYNPVAVTFEFPWFGRTPDDVRTAGRTALWALLRALDEPAGKGTR